MLDVGEQRQRGERTARDERKASVGAVRQPFSSAHSVAHQHPAYAFTLGGLLLLPAPVLARRWPAILTASRATKTRGSAAPSLGDVGRSFCRLSASRKEQAYRRAHGRREEGESAEEAKSFEEDNEMRGREAKGRDSDGEEMGREEGVRGGSLFPIEAREKL